MKKTIIISLLACALITITNCKKKSTQNNTSNNSTTVPTNTTTTTGKVVITASWNSTYVMCTGAYNTVIGLGYSSTDVANEAYFAQSNYTGSSANFSKDLLAPGVYYYRAKKTYNSTKCGTGQGIPPVVTKSGAFTITAGQTTTVSVGSLN
jgi:hypothetical protein